MPAAVESMAYRGEKPWHGLGNPVSGIVSTKQMLVAAQLDWPVALGDVQFTLDDRLYSAPDYKVLYRVDNRKVFDIVGKVYKPTQNEHVLEFFREYVEAGEMELETAGSLNDGKHIWALAKMHEHFILGKGLDRVEGYVLLMNPHQYAKAMMVKLTRIRVVCWNTLTSAIGSGSEGIKIWHSREFDKAAMDEAKRRLGIAREQMGAFQQDAETLVALMVDKEEATRVIAHAFKTDEKKPYEEQTRTVKHVVDLYAGEGIGANLETAKDTGWGVLNAVTQYIDHEYGRTRNRRLTNSWMGGGEVTKRRAQVELLRVARAGA